MTAEHTFSPHIAALQAKNAEIKKNTIDVDGKRTARLLMKQDALYNNLRNGAYVNTATEATTQTGVNYPETSETVEGTAVLLATLATVIAVFERVGKWRRRPFNKIRIPVFNPDTTVCCSSNVAFPIAVELARILTAVDPNVCSAHYKVSTVAEDNKRGSTHSHWVIELTFPAQRNV